MNIDFRKIEAVVIIDENGKVADRFKLSSASLVKGQLTGTVLELRKLPIKKTNETTEIHNH